MLSSGLILSFLFVFHLFRLYLFVFSFHFVFIFFDSDIREILLNRFFEIIISPRAWPNFCYLHRFSWLILHFLSCLFLFFDSESRVESMLLFFQIRLILFVFCVFTRSVSARFAPLRSYAVVFSSFFYSNDVKSAHTSQELQQ